MSSRRSLSVRLDRLAVGSGPHPQAALLAYARAVIVFGGATPSPASSAALARWLAGGWRERA